MSNDVKIDSNKITKLRCINCWSQEELAAVSGLSVRTIQRVEKTGSASLETTKSLAAVFAVAHTELQQPIGLEASTFQFVVKYAWLVAFGAASILFGLWIIDILISTLKGADFDQQYEIHGNFRYLDYGDLSFILGFALLSVNMSLEFLERKKLLRSAPIKNPILV